MNQINQKIFNLAGDRYLYLSDYNQVINAGIKELFLEHGSERKVFMQEVDIDEEVVKKRITSVPLLTFEITQNCNLRCKYCVYNGHYINERKFSPLNMDSETAKKGLDYLFPFIRERKKKTFFLGFYGGEPLLNIDTIKKIVAYGKKLFTGWNLGFNMTTNLTLLDEAILDFLIENNFLLLVSLDGGKENHDAKRVFADGRGTFDIVIKNLEKIADKDRDYFEERVGFSTVYSPDLPFKNQYDFFTSSDLVKNKRVRLSQVKQFNTDYYESYPYDRETFLKERSDIFSRILDKVRQGEELTSYEGFLYNNFTAVGNSIKTRVCTTLAGACRFDSRLYLDARGRFHICERMNDSFSFGDVNRGLDFEKMVNMVRDYCTVIKAHCSGCNIRFLCNRCYIQLAGAGEFRMDPEFCSQQREVIINNMEGYIQCKEEGLV